MNLPNGCSNETIANSNNANGITIFETCWDYAIIQNIMRSVVSNLWLVVPWLNNSKRTRWAQRWHKLNGDKTGNVDYTYRGSAAKGELYQLYYFRCMGESKWQQCRKDDLRKAMKIMNWSEHRKHWLDLPMIRSKRKDFNNYMTNSVAESLSVKWQLPKQ